MNMISGSISPKKSRIKLTRNELNQSPTFMKRRRKSSIPLQLKEMLRNNCLNQITQDPSTKKSYKGEHTTSKYYLNNMINNSIPEVSEISSNNNKDEKIKEEKKQKKKKKKKKEKKGKKENKKEIESNNYYIHYIKNIYENEPHLNKENIISSDNKKINDSYLKLIESNKNIKPVNRRRNSAIDKNFLKSNFHNINIDKDQINSQKTEKILNKMKSSNILNIFHKKQLDEKEKIVKSFVNNSKSKSNHKNKEKSKNKDKDKIKEKDKDDENIINNVNNINEFRNSITKIKKIKQKNSFDNERKTETENNTEKLKINKKCRFKKLFCCFINNGDSSIENE